MNGLAPRILIVDDDPQIHAQFDRCLQTPKSSGSLGEMERSLFGDRGARGGQAPVEFSIVHVHQGAGAVTEVAASLKAERPYSLAFVDMQMAPGIDGLETVERLWKIDPHLQIVICTAYSERSVEEIRSRLPHADRFLIIKKPFEPIEVQQLAAAMTEKWALQQRATEILDSAQALVARRTRELEESTRRLHRELEERAKIEAELTHSRSLEALGHIASGLGHEIRNPLAYVASNLEFLREGLTDHADAFPEDFREEAQEALVDSIAGLKIIDEIVRGIRLVGPRQSEISSEIDLNEVLNLSLKVSMAQIRKVAEVEVNLSGHPLIRASETQLGQVFVNLLINAAHAMQGTERPRHQLTLRSFQRRSGEWVVEVEDTGSGIPANLVDRIMEPHVTTKPVGQGSGLGLSIVRDILANLDGRLEIESEEGVGTCMRILLPSGEDEIGGEGESAA